MILYLVSWRGLPDAPPKELPQCDINSIYDIVRAVGKDVGINCIACGVNCTPGMSRKEFEDTQLSKNTYHDPNGEYFILKTSITATIPVNNLREVDGVVHKERAWWDRISWLYVWEKPNTR